MNKVKFFFEILLSLPKSFWINIHFFSFCDAIKMPIIVHYNVKLAALSGKIVLKMKKTGTIKVGFGGSFALGNRSFFCIEGNVEFKGKASFSRGSQIIVGKSGNLILGNDFRCNAGCIINSNSEISFGDDCLLAWNVTCLDSDGHTVMEGNIIRNASKPIHVGAHVWICPNATLLKGTEIANNSIVATGAVVTHAFFEENVLIGNTDQVLKRHIVWKN